MNQSEFDALAASGKGAERLDTIRRLREMLQDELRTENTRHQLAVTFLTHSLDELKTQCPHPVSELEKHYGVFPEAIYHTCYICGAEL